jgi:aldose 1-epimerase
VSRSPFGTLPDGTAIDLFGLTSARGTALGVISLGGTIVSLRVPDRRGTLDDVVLGFDTLAGYLAHREYFSAIVGRHANRIRGGRFTVDGTTHQLTRNDDGHHLHGGDRGFDRVVWLVQPTDGDAGPGVALRHSSPAGHEGYPGRLDVEVRYSLTDTDALIVEFDATTDAPAPVNLTLHTCFNLAGAASADVLDHELRIAADQFTPVDEALIPTGELAPVDGTPLDFREPMRIGARIGERHTQLERAGGYDHNFVLRRSGAGLVPAARVVEPRTGRTLHVATTEPGLHLFTCNTFDGSIEGKGGRAYRRHAGLCLETQHFPNAPNEPAFPSTILRPGEPFHSRTVFAFGTDRG